MSESNRRVRRRAHPNPAIGARYRAPVAASGQGVEIIDDLQAALDEFTALAESLWGIDIDLAEEA